MWFLGQDPGWSELILARASVSWKRANTEPKGQTKILGPPSAIWHQISEIWLQKGQPGNLALYWAW